MEPTKGRRYETMDQRRAEWLVEEENAGWTLHTADLRGDTDIRTHSVELDRLPALSVRSGALVSLGATLERPSVLRLPERYLSPRYPYQGTPMSYLNVYGAGGWSLFAEDDRLEWADFGGPFGAGVVTAWFRNVTPGSTAVVSLQAYVSVDSPGGSGTLQMYASGAAPRTFPVTGGSNRIFDVVIHPTGSFAAVVQLEVQPGIGYFVFKSIDYRTI